MTIADLDLTRLERGFEELELARDHRWLIDIVLGLRGDQPSNWAVLCVCFQDDPGQLPALDHRRKLFTGAGTGASNMVDFFNDMTHGQLDLTDSKVLGWYRLGQPRSDYVGNVYPQPAGKLNRNGLLDAARAAATANGVDLTKFAGVVVSAYGGTDLCGWVGGMAALCDDNSLQPSLLGQEMGHGYGLDHARIDGSTDDYLDPWDVMSTAAWPGMESPNADYVDIGPGLNAWSMRSRGWLKESRVWKGSAPPEGTIVTLRPLHQRFHPGYLAAELDQYLVELRVPERWDAAIGRPVVLVHRFADNHPYLMPGVGGSGGLGEGDGFRHGSPEGFFDSYSQVEVLGIDEKNHEATVRLSHRPRHHVPFGHDSIGGELVGGVAVGGSGGIIVNGHFHPVPPRGPEHEILAALAHHLSTPSSIAVAWSVETRRQLMRHIVKQALALHNELEVVSETPPGFEPGRIGEGEIRG